MQQFDWAKFYKHTRERPPWPRMIRAASLVTHRERALDLGCGAGRDTRYLLEQGFRVTAVDADANSMAILATFPQERLHAVQSSFGDFAFESNSTLFLARCGKPSIPKASLWVSSSAYMINGTQESARRR